MLGAKGVHLVIQVDQDSGSEHEDSASGIGFTVPQQVARKQAVGPVGKGTTKVISAPIPAGMNGSVTKTGPKSQDDLIGH